MLRTNCQHLKFLCNIFILNIIYKNIIEPYENSEITLCINFLNFKS